MIPLDITPNIDLAPWTEIDVNAMTEAQLEKIGLMPNGTESGQPAVMMKLLMPDGSVVIAQTTWKLFRATARALEGAVEFHGMMDGVDDR